MRNHRGFTLVELLVVLLIMVVVTGGIYKLLNSTQRLSRAQAERVDLQSNVRTASLVIPNELREINTVVGAAAASPRVDILAKSATSITYRAMRGLGFVCAGTTATQLRLSRWTGYRPPVALRDSVYVFIELDEDLSSDDAWLSRRITSTASGNTCAAGVPATTLNIDDLGSIPAVGTPVRTFEVMELSLYQVDGKSWLGARSVSNNENLQPLLGPLKDADGIEFSYLNATGGAAALNSDVKSIILKVRGVTSQQVSSGSGNAYNTYVRDSLVSQVSLRNALR